AFTRDGALPRFFDHVDKRFHSPVRPVWLATFLAFCLSLPSLGSTVAFSAATSIATIGLYISYALPILMAVAWRKNFVKGAFDLGRFSLRWGLYVILEVLFITVVFCLPEASPVTSQTLNKTSVAVGIVAVGTLGSWIVWASLVPKSYAAAGSSSWNGAAWDRCRGEDCGGARGGERVEG
ncbi:amino acid permease-domain-containing protein, partial [Lipomyces kononenkoae]